MNKYTLHFKDREVEEKYQKAVQNSFRMFTLNSVTIAMILLCVSKLIEQGLAKNQQMTIIYSCAICYLLIQYFVAKNHKHGVRIALVLINHMISILFNLQIKDAEDYYYSFLRGANVMGANFIIAISGEFIDAAVSTVTTSLIRTIMVILRSERVEVSALLSTLLIGLITSRYLYQSHKAFRSQFMLTLNDSHWEKILSSIAFKSPHLLFSFAEENFNFSLIQEGLSTSFFKFQLEGHSFLKHAKIKGMKLENYLYLQIKKFSKDRLSIFNQNLVVEYCKKLVRIEFSIFYGNKPSLLILLKDYLKERRSDVALYEKRDRILLKLLRKVAKGSDNTKQLKFDNITLQRNLLQIQLLEDLKKGKIQQSQINFLWLIQILNKLYPKLKMKVASDRNQTIQTIPNILILLLLFIAEQTTASTLTFSLSNRIECITKILSVKGEFDVKKLSKQLSSIYDYFRLIIQSQNLEDYNLQFQFNQQIFVPFWITEIASESMEEIMF